MTHESTRGIKWDVNSNLPQSISGAELQGEQHVIKEAIHWIDNGITTVDLTKFGERYLDVLDLLAGYRYKFAKLVVHWVVSVALNCPNVKVEEEIIRLMNDVSFPHGLPINESGLLNIIDFVSDLQRVGFTAWLAASITASEEKTSPSYMEHRIQTELAERELEMGFNKPMIHE